MRAGSSIGIQTFKSACQYLREWNGQAIRNSLCMDVDPLPGLYLCDVSRWGAGGKWNASQMPGWGLTYFLVLTFMWTSLSHIRYIEAFSFLLSFLYFFSCPMFWLGTNACPLESYARVEVLCFKPLMLLNLLSIFWKVRTSCLLKSGLLFSWLLQVYVFITLWSLCRIWR